MGEALVRELATMLGAQETALGMLVDVLDEQERLLVRADASGLVVLLANQQHLLSEIVALETTRMRITEALAGDLGVPPATVTLGSLGSRFPRLADDLRDRRSRLIALVRRVADMNRRNGVLAELSLGYVARLLDHLVTALAPAPTYGAAGRARVGAASAGLLDREA
jgi:flagellar biosynthesis/type III secretory pathway chaperone